LMISPRAGRNKSSWRSSRDWLMAVPLTANLAVEGNTNRPSPESRNARKQQPTTGFLAKSNTCSGQITAMVQSLPNSSRATIRRRGICSIRSHGLQSLSLDVICELASFILDPQTRKR
jgi:hypothetical protein